MFLQRQRSGNHYVEKLNKNCLNILTSKNSVYGLYMM